MLDGLIKLTITHGALIILSTLIIIFQDILISVFSLIILDSHTKLVGTRGVSSILGTFC